MKEQELLSLVMNHLTERWDNVESLDPDKSTEKWRSYKGIRNNTRDWINEIAKAHGFDLLK